MATKLIYRNQPSSAVISFEGSFDGAGLYFFTSRRFNELELTGISAETLSTSLSADQFIIETVEPNDTKSAPIDLVVVRAIVDVNADVHPVVLVSGIAGKYTVNDTVIELTYAGTYGSAPEELGSICLDLPHASKIGGDAMPVGRTLVWDGRASGRASLVMSDTMTLYKISDVVFDVVDFTDANCQYSSGNQVSNITNNKLTVSAATSPVDGVAMFVEAYVDLNTYTGVQTMVLSAEAGDYDGVVIEEGGTYIGCLSLTDGGTLYPSQLRLPNAPDMVFKWNGDIASVDPDTVVTATFKDGLVSSQMLKVSDEVLNPFEAVDYLVSVNAMGMDVPSTLSCMMSALSESESNLDLPFVVDYLGCYLSGKAGTYLDGSVVIPEDGTYVMVNPDDPTMPVTAKFYKTRIPKGIRMYVPPADNANAVFGTVSGENTFIKVDSNIYTVEELATAEIEFQGVTEAWGTFDEVGWVDLNGSLLCDYMFTGRAGTYTLANGIAITIPEDGTYLVTEGYGACVVLPNAVHRLNEHGFYYHKPYTIGYLGMIDMAFIFTESDVFLKASYLGTSIEQWLSASDDFEYEVLQEFGFTIIATSEFMFLVSPTGMSMVLADSGVLMAAKLPWNSVAFDDFTGEPNDGVYVPPEDAPNVDTPTYVITFQDWDGTVISQTEYAEGDAIVIPTDPMRESDGETNYIFKEWTPEVSATAVADAVYTAVYEETTSTVFTITFVDWDDSVIDSRRYIEGTVIDYPPNPTRPDDADFHYDFDTWTPSVPATATADGTYKATYVATPCYLIEFVDWDGTVISSQRYLQDTVITVPENPTRASDGVYDYEFDKWTPEVFGVAVAHATYTATYTSTLIPVFYDVIFKDWDGTVISSVNYAAGDTVKIPPDPTRESDGIYTYAFSGWNPTVSSIASANVTYTATYTATEIPVYYDIVFVDWNGTILSNTPTLKNTNIVVPPDPVREPADGYEYTFIGWEPAVQTKATDHATYQATYSATRVYNDVLEIFANTAELVVNRNNSKNDDSTDTLNGVSWFTYSGTVCNKVYISGNHWFGLGSNAEHLKINRRDGATWYTYREEGELYKYYKFLRFRVSGYTVHNTTNSSNKITYDVILWDTGDISIYMVDVPTSSYDGIFSLGSLSYTKPTVENPHVTFYLQDDGTYNVVYEPIFLELPFDKKYLVKVYDDTGYTLYTVVDGALSALETKDLTAETFAQYGCDELPSGDLLMSYGHFEVIYWFGNDAYVPEVRATVTAIPYPQTVESRDYDMSHGTIHGIEKVLAVATEDVSFALSIDSGASWMCFKDGVWVALSENDSGMSAVTMNAITTEQWNSAVTTGKYRFRMTLVDETSIFTSLVVDYLNEVE